MGIPYCREIERAYEDLPQLDLGELQYGDVVNLTPGDVGWWPWDLPARATWASIVEYNRREYPARIHDYVYGVHTVIYTDHGRYFEVAAPEARWGDFCNSTVDRTRWFIVCRYADQEGNWLSETEKRIFRAVFRELEGVGYDYGQLIDILINQMMGWSPADYLSIFDLGRSRKVCSVAARIAWLRWWKEYGREHLSHSRRPGGNLNAERTSPALFENHETFNVVGRLVLDGRMAWGKGRRWSCRG